MPTRFTGNFTQQDPIPSDAIERAVEVMQTGRLHRYNLTEGETGEVSALEQAFAAYMGADFCLAVASGGYAIATALRACGVGQGTPVLTNAFTLAPVPGAIASVGGQPVFVEVTEDLTIDLQDLADKADQAKILLLSHMRGHVCDMDRLMEICEAAGIVVIEDCAHTMGARWRGVLSGRHGAMACYSTQTYKHMNSGEGGLLISGDPDVMARAILLSGSYMLYERHGAAPDPGVFEGLKLETPNISGRMDHLRAAILRPQLDLLDAKCAAWTERYRTVERHLRGVPGVRVVERPQAEAFVGSSIQFLLLDRPADVLERYLSVCAARGVELKWFGADKPTAFTSRYDHWRYADPEPLPRTDRILAGLVDMRLPLTFSLEDCDLIGRILAEEATALAQRAAE